MASPTESKSVSLIITHCQQSRSASDPPKPRAKAGSGGILNQSLTPVLPPLYPPAAKPSTLNPEVATTVQVYNKFSQHFKSNFSMEADDINKNTGRYLERYTDQYKSPLALDDHLLHMLPDSKFPEELSTKLVPSSRKSVGLQKKPKKKVEDLPDTDETLRERIDSKIIHVKQELASEDEDEEKEDANVEDVDEYEDDDMDEEMDQGTDYSLSYFDNGDGDDDDRDGDDDGPTF